MAAVKFTAKLTGSSGGTAKLKTKRVFHASFAGSSSGSAKFSARALFSAIFSGISGGAAQFTFKGKEVEQLPVGGRWPGLVGSRGYILPFFAATEGSGTPPVGDLTALPPGITYKVTGANSFAWKQPEPIGTTEQRAVSDPTKTNAAECTWYEGFWNLEIKSSKQFYGTITFYILDHDRIGREQKIEDGVTTRTFSNYGEGMYVSYEKAIAPGGSVTFVFSLVSGPNAVCSGVFFDSVKQKKYIAVENGATGQLMEASQSLEAPYAAANSNEEWLLNNVFAGE